MKQQKNLYNLQLIYSKDILNAHHSIEIFQVFPMLVDFQSRVLSDVFFGADIRPVVTIDIGIRAVGLILKFPGCFSISSQEGQTSVVNCQNLFKVSLIYI